MIKKCQGWISNCAKKADEYYRAMAAWIRSGRPRARVGELIRIGAAYRWTLNKAVKCLESLRRTEKVEKQIEQTKESETLITTELKALQELE